MGYTHYWRQEEWTQEDKNGFLRALPIVREIIERYKDILTDVTVKDTTIFFNGEYETFHAESEKQEFNCCKTGRKNYDVTICEILLVLYAMYPNFKLSSDGFSGYTGTNDLDGEWMAAIENVRQYGFNYGVEVINEEINIATLD